MEDKTGDRWGSDGAHADHDHLDDGTCVDGYLVPRYIQDSAAFQAAVASVLLEDDPDAVG